MLGSIFRPEETGKEQEWSNGTEFSGSLDQPREVRTSLFQDLGEWERSKKRVGEGRSLVEKKAFSGDRPHWPRASNRLGTPKISE